MAPAGKEFMIKETEEPDNQMATVTPHHEDCWKQWMFFASCRIKLCIIVHCMDNSE